VVSTTDHYVYAWHSECNSVRYVYAYCINIAFNIVYAAKYLHKNSVNLNWYSISFFKLHISARVSMHKADELAVNITFVLYINTTGFTNEVCIPHYIVYKNTQSSVESVHMHFVS
jgi:hypothetical protein